MKPSNLAIWATVIGAGVAAHFAGPGLGFLVAIVGTFAVVVLAHDEEQKAREMAERRQALLEAARRER